MLSYNLQFCGLHTIESDEVEDVAVLVFLGFAHKLAVILRYSLERGFVVAQLCRL